MFGKAQGRALARVAAIATLATALVGCMGWVPGRQAYWDAKVREMCEKDGGVTIYERVTLTESQYRDLGGTRGAVPVPDESSENRGAPFFARTTSREINASNPRVTRRETEIIRRADGKVLGKVVIYSRVGGDVPTGIGHATYFSCQDLPDIKLDVERQLFVLSGDSK